MIYLASPYSAPDPVLMESRWQKAKEITALLISQGHHIFSPIVHCHELAQIQNLPKDAEFWLAYNTTFLRRCDGMFVLMIDGWKTSKGVTQEIAYAKQLHISIVYVNERGLIQFGEPR